MKFVTALLMVLLPALLLPDAETKPFIESEIWRDDFKPCGRHEKNCFNGGLRTSNWRMQWGPAAPSPWGDKYECYRNTTDVLAVHPNPRKHSDGILTISVIHTPRPFTCLSSDGSRDMREWKTGALNSQRLQAFRWKRKGRSYRSIIVEVRAKMPDGGNGIWAGFWMRPDEKSPYGVWPKDGELDLFEHVKSNGIMAQSVHFAGKDGGLDFLVARTDLDTSAMTAFHTYSLEWSPLYIRYYIDGVMTSEVSRAVWNAGYAQHHDSPSAPFDAPFYLLTKMSVGGVWAGTPDESTVGRASMSIDWVRAGYGPKQHM